MQLDIWARDGGRVRPAREIVDAVQEALHLAPLMLTVNALALIRVVSARVLLDPDGLTAHGVILVEAVIEER